MLSSHLYTFPHCGINNGVFFLEKMLFTNTFTTVSVQPVTIKKKIFTGMKLCPYQKFQTFP